MTAMAARPPADDVDRQRIAAERRHREHLVVERGRLLRLRATLDGARVDDSVRADAAKLAHLETAAQLEAIDTRLASIDDALRRLREARFGSCEECGGVIPEARLEARPDARLCVACCQRQGGPA